MNVYPGKLYNRNYQNGYFSGHKFESWIKISYLLPMSIIGFCGTKEYNQIISSQKIYLSECTVYSNYQMLIVLKAMHIK